MTGKLLVGMILIVALSASAVRATSIPVITVTVDENGKGSIGPLDLTGSLMADPNRPDHRVLAYVLPAPVTPGDVVLNEPGRSQGGSDLIRFINVTAVDDETDDNGDTKPNTGTSDGDDDEETAKSLLLFYSDTASTGEAPTLADVGVPTALQPNHKAFDETGLFGKTYSDAGPNGLVYTPGAGDPGSLLAGVGEISANTVVGISPNYVFISDAAGTPPPGTPLPASDWAGLALLGGIGAWRQWRRVAKSCGRPRQA